MSASTCPSWCGFGPQPDDRPPIEHNHVKILASIDREDLSVLVFMRQGVLGGPPEIELSHVRADSAEPEVCLLQPEAAAFLARVLSATAGQSELGDVLAAAAVEAEAGLQEWLSSGRTIPAPVTPEPLWASR